MPALRPQDVAGPRRIRAQALGRDGALLDDFRSPAPGAVHVLNAPLAATASLAIAEMIASEVA